MRSTTYDPAGTVADGIAAFERAVADGHGADSSGRYRYLAGEVRSAMQPGDTCALAFAADLDRPGGWRGSAPAFVAVLDDRVVVAWRCGRLRPRSEAVVVPRNSISGLRTSAGSHERAHLLVTIDGGDNGNADSDIVLVAPAGTGSVLDDVLSRTSTPTTVRSVSRQC